jgi:hypothetical protein
MLHYAHRHSTEAAGHIIPTSANQLLVIGETKMVSYQCGIRTSNHSFSITFNALTTALSGLGKGKGVLDLLIRNLPL